MSALAKPVYTTNQTAPNPTPEDYTAAISAASTHAERLKLLSEKQVAERALLPTRLVPERSEKADPYRTRNGDSWRRILKEKQAGDRKRRRDLVSSRDIKDKSPNLRRIYRLSKLSPPPPPPPLATPEKRPVSTQLELELGIDFAPAIVLEHGLKDAHVRPLVSLRKGQSFRVHARDAWAYPSLELRAANCWPAVTLDCDVPSAVVDALYRNHHGGEGPALPRPNMVVERSSNSHCHASWFLSRPVHRGELARAAPLRKLARITEFYREALEADTGYAGVLTHNPLEETHGPREFQTHWGHSCAYSLDELSAPIPHGWRLPTTPSTETGRNCSLFRSLLKWAGSLENSELPVLPMARATNETVDPPLQDSEVVDIAKSVERYRRTWIAKGRFYTKDEREAWGRSLGLQGGVVRRASKADRDVRIVEGHRAGFSTRKLARLFKLTQQGIWHVLQRDLSR